MENQTTNKVEETTEVIAPVAETTTDTEVEAIDYEKLYTETSERLGKAEHTIITLKKAKKVAPAEQAIEEPEEEAEEEQESTPVQPDLYKVVREVMQETTRETVIEQEIAKRASSAAEAKLIRLQYDRGIQKTGTTPEQIAYDIENAHFLANKSKFLKQQGELGHALVAKKTIGNSGIGTNMDKQGPADDLSKHFDKHSWDFMKSHGWSDEKIKKAIPNN